MMLVTYAQYGKGVSWWRTFVIRTGSSGRQPYLSAKSMLRELPATKTFKKAEVTGEVRQPPRFRHVQRRFCVRERFRWYHMVKRPGVE
jgi:hypothetical protein